MPRAENSAQKGCRRCHTRRIACDLSEPSCKKCLKKGFECPGYGRDYRWTNAVAVRGYLRGRNVPVRPPQAADSQAAPARSSSSATAALSQPPHGPEYFLEHFVFAIAPLMVWIDSERNEYKKLIPLARRQPVLMLSMQAASAAHLAEDVETSDRLRDEAIAMINAMLKQMLDTGDDVPMQQDSDGERLEALLASMLILSSHSLISAKPTEAQAHRLAARTITNVLSGREHESQTRFRFLKNQLALYEIMACTTLSQAESVQVYSEELFNEHMTLLHGITRLSCERERAENVPPLPSVEELETQFDMALGSALLSASPLLDGRSEPFRRDFVRLVHLYHHAGILYAFDRLKLQENFTIRDTSRRKIFTILESFEDLPSMFQNIPWPVFIAGTAADQDEKQKLVCDIFRSLSTSTYFGHYMNIIDFLEDLWKDPRTNWIDLAQRYELNSSPVIAI